MRPASCVVSATRRRAHHNTTEEKRMGESKSCSQNPAGRRPGVTLAFLVMVMMVVPATTTSCAAGFRAGSSGEACVACPQGTFKPSVGGDECTPCPMVGAFSPLGSTEESACVGGESPQSVCYGGAGGLNDPKAFWCPLDKSTDLQWCGLPSSPPAKIRHGHTLVAVDEFVIMYGGLIYDDVGYESWGSDDEATYFLDANMPRLAWQSVRAGMETPAGRHFHSAVVIQNSMIIFGGTAAAVSEEDFSSPWTLSLTSLTWKKITVGNNGPAVQPSGRWYGHSAVAVDGDMVVYGGRSGDNEACTDAVWKLSTLTSHWTSVSTSGNSPGGLCWHTAAMYADESGSRMVVAGGYSDPAAEVPSTQIWSLDTQTWTWTSLSSQIPSAISGAVFHMGALVVFSGACHSVPGCVASSFDLDSKEFTPIDVTAASSVSGEVNSSAIAVGGKQQKMVSTVTGIFVLGGASYNSFQSYVLKAEDVKFMLPLVGLEGTVELSGKDGFFGLGVDTYPPTSHLSFQISEILFPADTRESSKISPDARERFAMVAIQDEIALFGGASSIHAAVGQIEITIFDDTWILDRSTNSWTQLLFEGAAPSARQGHTMVTRMTTDETTLAYMFGGASGYVSPSSWLPCSGCSQTYLVSDSYHAFNETWVLDIEAGSWSLQPSDTAPENREGHSAVVVGGQMIIVGGVDFSPASVQRSLFRGRQFGDVWALGLDSGTWTKMSTTNGGPGEIFHHAAMVKGSDILIAGGVRIGVDGSLHFHDDLWELSSTFAWRKIPVAGQVAARAGHTAVLVGSSIMMFGGYHLDLDACPNNQTTSCVVSSSDTFKAVANSGDHEYEFVEIFSANPPAARRCHAGIMVGPDLFIMGGSNEWVEDGARWKTQFPDSAYLPVSSIVPRNMTAPSGMYVALAMNYQSVMLPSSVTFSGAAVFSSSVLVEPYMTSMAAISTMQVGSERTLLCAAQHGCDNLAIRHLDFDASSSSASEDPLLQVVGPDTTVSVMLSTFTNVGCTSSGCSAFIREGASVDFTNVEFSGGSSTSDGGALAVVGASVTVSRCHFEDTNATGFGGAIFAVGIGSSSYSQELVDFAATLNVHNSSFVSNTAGGGGGAAMCGNSAACSFMGSSFTTNEALFTSSGGAVLAQSVTSITMTGTSFADNSAEGGAGGSVFWVGQPLEADVEHAMLCTSTGDALYGPCVASNAINTVLSNTSQYTRQYPGLQIEPNPSIRVVDWYNQTVTVSGASMIANLYVTEPLSAIMQGVTAVAQDPQTLTFDFHDAWLLAGIASVDASSVTWRSTIHLQFLVLDPYTNTELPTPDLTISPADDVCPVGWILQVSEWNLVDVDGGSAEDLFGACSKCPPTTYSLDPLFGEPSCQPCPIGAACAGGKSKPQGVGDYRQNGTTWRLVSCPAGYSLDRGNGPDQQQCRQCETDGSEYIIHPNTSPCQKCPPGLICAGDKRVTPVVEGSNWTRVGEQFRLQSCPAGYFRVNDVVSEERCEPCPAGTQCVAGGCDEDECTACPAGTFKDAATPQACGPCPRNTYNPSNGATAMAACLPCQASATGVEEGATSIDNCVCESTLYLLKNDTCSVCPAGALCPDGDCSLSRPNRLCADDETVLGEWERGDDGEYRLVSCPEGYELQNFSEVGHDDQACVQCHPTQQYIIDPNTGTCQTCPEGLECTGSSVVTTRTVNATWEIIDNVYRLVSCPPHYVKDDGDGDLSAQACLPCPVGTQCPAGDCTTCLDCPEGTYKDFASAMPCISCPRGTFRQNPGATMRSDCESCPDGAVTDEDRQTSAEACKCGQDYYLRVGSAGSGSGLQCEVCPTGALCPDGTCALPDMTCDGTKIVGEWNLTSNGTYELLGCPQGYALINSVDGTSNGEFDAAIQQCKMCDPLREYNVDPNKYQCTACPPGPLGKYLGSGLECFGNATVNKRLDASRWEIINGTYHLQYCPPGYYADTDPLEEQQCKICGVGVTCADGGCDSCTPCPPGFYKSIPGLEECRPCPADTFSAITAASCTACPVGASTNNASRQDSESDCVCDGKYYTSYIEETGLVCNQCPRGALCRDGDCGALAENATAPMCADNTAIVGTWEKNEDGRYVLKSCPEGHSLVNSSDGTSRGEFAHDLQQCRKCTTAEYILRPNQDTCQDCPPGLTCDGSSDVTMVLGGSNWTTSLEDGEMVYRLVDCPTGYSKSGSLPETEECVVCPRGTQCVTDRCTTCEACPIGTYKENGGAFACANCPINTFGKDAGATSLAQCQNCPRYSYTDGDGQTDASACECDRFYYLLDGSPPKCSVCPTGAVCPDLSCGLARPNFTCPDGNRVVGDWTQDDTGEYRLRSCPAGHSLINTTTGDQSGPYFHDGQRCKPCDDPTEYIINPNTDQCQKCPPGLRCRGDDHVDPVVDSSWKIVDDVYYLVNCTSGYYPFRSSSQNAALQRCLPCGVGEYCDAGCQTCSPCSPGTYKDSTSILPCTHCPANTFGTSSGATDRTDCEACPTGATTDGTGHSDVVACTCSIYTFRRDMNDGTAQCGTCPDGAVCNSGACAFAEDRDACPDRDKLLGDWIYEDGNWVLKRCPPGHELQNTLPGGVFDLEIQHCRPCLPGLEYIINPNNDTCQKCPAGLVCIGNPDPTGTFTGDDGVTEDDLPSVASGGNNASAWVESRVDGADWKPQNGVWTLISCPSGYFVENDLPETQRCTPCPAGKQCSAPPCTECSDCPAGTYKGAAGVFDCMPCPFGTYNQNTGGAQLSACTACPRGATTTTRGATSFNNCTCGARQYTTFPTGTPFECESCPRGARCSDDSCAFNLYVFNEDGSLDADLPGNSGLARARGMPGCNPNANENSAANIRCSEESWFNFTCKDGAVVVGDWVRGDNGKYTLEGCPDGYSRKTNPESEMRCQKCQDWEYIINPNTDECQTCPTGLICDGTAIAVPKQTGAKWEPVGDEFRLVSCPTGYRLYNESTITQQCVPCDIGTECLTEECKVCRACPLGSYKEGSGPYECFPCPLGTYDDRDQPVGGTTVDVCKSCPDKSTTASNGATDKHLCECNEFTYRVDTADKFSCEDCPVGAMCADSTCGLRNEPTFQCEDGADTIGQWVRDDEGWYRLVSCPAGYSLVNTSADGSFFHDGQQCRKCFQDQYILHPNTDECQSCPPGLICDGTNVVFPRTEGSVWEEEGDILVLKTCPTGYAVYNGPFDSVFHAAVQRCTACGQGEECTLDACTECTQCVAGKYKDFAGTDACRDCPVNTYAEQNGTSTPCDECPEGSTTLGMSRQTDSSACKCEDRTYLTFDLTRGRSVPICSKCPLGAICPDETCAFQHGGFTPGQAITCPGGDTIEGNWTQDETGLWRLESCPYGYSLINSTHGTSFGWFSNAAQHCKKCHEETRYILDPNTDACQPCPSGLVCDGGSDVEPVTPGSDWSIQNRPRNDLYVLNACPSGHEVFTPNLLVQECRPCDMGSHCPGINGTANCTTCTLCPVGHYKDSAGTYDCRACPVDTYCPIEGARDVTECRACPDGAFTVAGGQFSEDACTCARDRYPVRSPEGELICETCPKGAECFDGSCALGRSNRSCSGEEELIGDWVLPVNGTQFLLESCPSGYSLVNSTGGTSSGEFSHDVQHCRKCMEVLEYIINPNTDQCQKCPMGLLCNGTETVVSRTPGAKWVIDDGVEDATGSKWMLESCGTGYKRESPSVDFQRCEPCGVGQECAADACTVCTPCQPGTYKPSESGSLCTACPVNTYGPDNGATSFSQCLECPDNSFTQGGGHSARESCMCLPSAYEASPGAVRDCITCPFGARCLDGSCAFSRTPASCPNEDDTPLGTWTKDSTTDEWVLRSCPDGTQLVNSTAGTSSGEFLAEIQQCQQCAASEYILNPNTDQCQKCPVGLKCNGGKDVVPRVANSTWVRDGDIWKLQSCATGHYVFAGAPGEFDELAQTCEPCELGEECGAEQCTECTPCVAGTYKDTKSPEMCIPCGPNTYNPNTMSRSASDCIACPTGASTPGPGQTSRDQCTCSDFTYTAFDSNDVMRCRTCPEGAKCLDQSCAFAQPDQVCEEAGGDVPVVGSWAQNDDDEFILTACPEGHKLVNGTEGSSGRFVHDLQKCERCPRNSYILGMLLDCKTCPPGLACNGTSKVESIVTGAEWVQVGDDLVLESCPTGYKRVGPDLADLANAQNFEFLQQQCVPCPVGQDCKAGGCTECVPCLAGSYKASVGPMECTRCPLHTYGLNNGSTSINDCTACPAGAVTVGLGSNKPEDCVCDLSTFQTSQDASSITCSACPIGGLCPGSICAFRQNPPSCDGELVPGEWVPDADGDMYLKSCPEGYSLQNTTIDGNFLYEAQQCVECLTSQYILDPNSGRPCQTCPMGFKCFGNSTIINKVPGSEWEQQGDEFILKSCPTGYKLISDTIPQQMCDPCPRGWECTAAKCFECTRCEPGYFKDTKSDTACIICPKDTYNPEYEGTNFANCERCPVGASTLNSGETKESACQCDPAFYPMRFDDGSLRCRTCPAGGVCDDGSCALRLPSQTCPQNGTDVKIVGEWFQDNITGTDLLGEFKVLSCPAGYSRMTALDETSTGDFFHDAQQCAKCQDLSEYIINPSSSTCKRCPTGLICSGDDKVVPVVNGSKWTVDGDIYLLEWCPPGYSLWNGSNGVFDQQAQECVECPKGEECVQEQCHACTLCPAGSFKDVIGPEPCTDCLQGYFSSTIGATTIQQCIACPKYSYTLDAGSTDLSQCICFDTLYRVSPPGGEPICNTCPAGAVCNVTDNRQCALSSPTLSCPSTGRILGEWSRNENDLYILRHCPRGTMMMNSTEGTTRGDFSHSIQQCRRCKTCGSDSGGPDAWCLNAQYNIEPNRYACHICPDGAECNGAELRTVGNLDVIGAEWRADSVGKLWLVKCPTGYRMRNDTGYEHQMCQKCAIGEYIFRSDDPAFECYPCPEGATCLNGGPPDFGSAAVESSITMEFDNATRRRLMSSDMSAFDDVAKTTLVKSLEENTGFPAGTIEITEACLDRGSGDVECIDYINPPTAPADNNRRALSRKEYEAALALYARREGARRSLLQATGSQWTINFRAIVPGVSSDELAKNFSKGDFATSVASTMKRINPAYANLQVRSPPNATNLGGLPNSRGEKYIMQPDGRAELVWCGNGYLLVNDTFQLRQCATCKPTTYSLHPLDNCNTIEQLGHCTLRDCTRCPRGAFCAGNNDFQPMEGSEWEVVYSTNMTAYQYRLKKCDIGKALVRLPNLAQEDECVPCPYGSYAFEATEYGDEWLQPSNPELLVSPLLCLRCPRGARCAGATDVKPMGDYWRGQNMICKTSECSKKDHRCSPYYCKAYPGKQQPGTDEDGELWRLRAMVYRCRPGHCIENLTSTTFELIGSDNVTLRRRGDLTVNFCREGHEGPLCGVCKNGWAKVGRNCAPCDGSFDHYRDLLLAFLLIFAIVMTYAAAWRPLMNDWEKAVKKWVKSKLENRDEHPTPTLLHHIHGWFHASLTDFLKIYISFFQVSGGFMTQVNVQWPNVLDDIFMVATSIVQIDVFTFPGLSCALRDIKFREKLIIMTSIVPTILFFLFIPSVLAGLRFRHKLHDCLNQFYYSAIFFIFITYGSTSRVVFDAYACSNLGVDGKWLRSDPSVICPEDDPDELTFWWAVFATFVYPLGVPVLLWSLLILHGVPKTVEQKQERAYLSAILETFLEANSIPEKITEKMLEDETADSGDRSREHREMVEVSVISAKHLPKMDVWGTIDPYVVLHLEDTPKRTQVVYDSNYEPEWGIDKATGEVYHEHPDDPSKTCLSDHPEYHNMPVAGEKFMFPLYDGMTQDLEVRCMDWDFGMLNPDDDVGTGWVTNEELRQLKPEDGKIVRKVVLEWNGEPVRNGADGLGQDAFVLLKLRKVGAEEMQMELDRMARLRKLLAFIGINYGDQVGQLSKDEQNEKIKELYDLRKREANTRDLVEEQLKNKNLWAKLEEEWQKDHANDKDQNDKDEKAKSKKAGLSLVTELEPERMARLAERIEHKLKKIANANKKKKESQGEHVKAMLQRVLGEDSEQYMEYGVREFREVLEEMGQADVGHSVIKGMIDRYGKDNKIDNPKIHQMVHKVILVREYLRGTEEPDDLDKRQLSELIYMSKFQQRTYRPSDAAHHHAKEPPAERLKKAQDERELQLKDNQRKLREREMDLTKKRDELRDILLSRAVQMETNGELTIPESQWVGTTDQERHAINRVGFLIYSYRCKYWWYEIADMFRKLLMITITVFGFDGTVSQVALGMMVTVMYLLLALIRQPYRNRTLGVMSLFSLSVQSVTFFYGIILATGELNELAGEEGSEQRRIMGILVTILNCLLVIIPILDLCFEILPGRYFIRMLLMKWFGMSKESVGIKEDAEKQVIKPRQIEEVKPHAQAQFHLLTLKTFLRERREKTNGIYAPDENEAEAEIVGYVPPNAELVFSNDAAQTGALARWVPRADPDADHEIQEAGARDQVELEAPSPRGREISFEVPSRLAMHKSAGGVVFVQKNGSQQSPRGPPNASQQKLAAETAKMQAAFQAATQPYLSKQQEAASAYSLRSPEDETDSISTPRSGAVRGGQTFDDALARKAAERRQVLEETLAELPEGSESRAQVEQMLKLMESGQSGKGAAGGSVASNLPPTVNPGYGDTTVDTTGSGDVSRSRSTYHQQRPDIHNTTIDSSKVGGGNAEQFPFQLLFGDGTAKVDPNAFILNQPGEAGAPQTRDLGDITPALDTVHVDRGKQAKDATRLGGKSSRMSLRKKKKKPVLWPAMDESDDEDDGRKEKELPREPSLVVEAEFVVGGSKRNSLQHPTSPSRSVQSESTSTTTPERSNAYFSRINVPLPHMHHHELFAHEETGEMDVTEEDIAVGGHRVAPQQVQGKYAAAPGLLVVDQSRKKEGGGGVFES